MTFEFDVNISTPIKDIFNSFLTKYSGVIERLHPVLGKTSLQIGIQSKDELNYDPVSPLMINDEKGIILINDIDEYTESEVHSLIAHEIGHSIGYGNDKEPECDRIAVNIGLIDSMRTSLIKMLKKYEDLEKSDPYVAMGCTSYSEQIKKLKNRLFLI